jgi:hypothetical protein
MVLGDGGILSEERVIVVSQRLGGVEQQHFRPVAHLVSGAGLERVAAQRERLRQVGKLLVMDAGGLAQRPRSHAVARTVEYSSQKPLFSVSTRCPPRARNPPGDEQRVAGDIQRRHHDHFVGAQVFGLGENEIHSGIQPVKRPVQPAHFQIVTARMVQGMSPAGCEVRNGM